MGVLHVRGASDVGKNGSFVYQTDNSYDLLTPTNLDRELHFCAIVVQEKIGFVSRSLGYFEFILIFVVNIMHRVFFNYTVFFSFT